MRITKQDLKQIILEELTKSDKDEIKKMIETELKKLLKQKESKKIIIDLTKKIMKKLYRDLSLEHPYIIDRINIWCYIVIMTDKDPFAAQFRQAEIGEWIYYPRTRTMGLVKSIHYETGFMIVHCFGTMKERWFKRKNMGQYMVLWMLAI